MRYLFVIKNEPPFLSPWFDAENHFEDNIGMVVCDLVNFKYTTDGTTWNDMEIDHL